MDKGIAQFQSLSRCEATQMRAEVAMTILHAYEVGFNLAVDYHDKPLDDLMISHRAALEAIGFGHISFADAMRMIGVCIDDKPKKAKNETKPEKKSCG